VAVSCCGRVLWAEDGFCAAKINFELQWFAVLHVVSGLAETSVCEPPPTALLHRSPIGWGCWVDVTEGLNDMVLLRTGDRRMRASLLLEEGAARREVAGPELTVGRCIARSFCGAVAGRLVVPLRRLSYDWAFERRKWGNRCCACGRDMKSLRVSASVTHPAPPLFVGHFFFVIGLWFHCKASKNIRRGGEGERD
jgi:hypothetical protein